MSQKSFLNHSPIDFTFAEDIARVLFKINAVILEPHNAITWKNGLKSPIYVNCRRFLGKVFERDLIKRASINYLIRNNILQRADAIAGIITGGGFLGYELALSLGLPFVYTMPSRKEHGMNNQIEGIAIEEVYRKKFVVIEDVFSTGKSAAEGVKVIRDNGGEVIEAISIFTYGFDDISKIFSGKLFEGSILSEPCSFKSLVSFKVLVDIGISDGYIDENDEDLLMSFIQDPEGWGLNLH